MHFHSSCITRYYVTESEMGFLRGNGVFHPTAIKSGLLATLLFWCINRWPLHWLICLLLFFRKTCQVESPKSRCKRCCDQSSGVWRKGNHGHLRRSRFQHIIAQGQGVLFFSLFHFHALNHACYETVLKVPGIHTL